MYQTWIEKFTQMRRNFFLRPYTDILTHLSDFSKLSEQFILQLWTQIRTNKEVHLFSVGGFGRGELFPYSDIDIVFHCRDPFKHDEEIAAFLMVLRDARLKVGHAVRNHSQLQLSMEDSVEVAVAYLDCRALEPAFSDQASDLRKKARNFLRKQDEGLTFVRQLITRFEQRRDRFGRSIYLLEPELKRGPGGLRDLQSLRWASLVRFDKDPIKDVEEEHFQLLKDAFRQSAELRWHLHLISKRDRLRFEFQEKMASQLGYFFPKELMKRHYLCARTIRKYTERSFREWSRIAQNPLQQPYSIHESDAPSSLEEQENLSVQSLIQPLSKLTEESVFGVLQQAVIQNALLSPRLENEIEAFCSTWDEKNEERNARFAKLLFDPATSWRSSRRLLEMGILMRLIPELKPLDCHVHHDLYHVYTTDAHSIRCLEFARHLLIVGNSLAHQNDHEKSRPKNDGIHDWIKEVAKKIEDKELMLAAALTHDIGKNRPSEEGVPRQGHSEKGAILADSFGPRLGFDNKQTRLLRFLILEHLTLSHAARRLDINDPRILRDLVSRVRTTQTLDALTLLTYCDISTLGPNAMTDWTSSLLQKLYTNIHQILTHGYEKRWEILQSLIEEKTLKLVSKIGDANEVGRFTRSLPIFHLQDCDVESLALQYKASKKIKVNGAQFLVHVDDESQTTELVIVCRDEPGILTKIAGSLSASGINIFSANIVSTTQHFVIDSFRLGTKTTESKYGPVPESRMQKGIENLKKVLRGTRNVQELLQRRISSSKTTGANAPTVLPATQWSNTVSDEFSVFEIKAPDRLGLLYAITACFFYANIDIVSSKIDSEGNTIIDTFFVQNNAGKKLDEGQGEALCASLLQCISERDSEKK